MRQESVIQDIPNQETFVKKLHVEQIRVVKNQMVQRHVLQVVLVRQNIQGRHIHALLQMVALVAIGEI